MNLKHLTDKTLLKDMSRLVDQEREILSKVLWHLKEIDRRKLYSDLQCGSLFEYCVKILKYSEGQASRRISAARMLKDMPEIAEKVGNGELNLTQLNQAKNFFHEEGIQDPEMKKKVIDEISGKTTRETEKILWTYRSEDTPRRVKVTLKEDTLELVKKVQACKAHSCPDLDSILVLMSETLLKVWDPKNIARKRKEGPGDTRYVQAGVKAKVWEKSKGKCQNCGSTYALEVDHIQPFSAGGKTVVENLQLLCRNCNQRKGFVQTGYMTSSCRAT